ncbi:MAG: diguanylate cyclase [Candidatus Brocadiia bacterium]
MAEEQTDNQPVAELAPRVLVVDDDENFLKLVKKFLEARGMTVIAARNADEAREEIRKATPEVIVSDLMMPGTKGDAFCRELQDDPVTSTIPFIVVSALRDPEIRISSFEYGAMDFIQKPLYMDELVARILAQVKKSRTVRMRLLTDALTGVRNRSYFNDELPRLFMLARRHNWPICMTVIDINSFKKINDTYLHSSGDYVLFAVAQELVRIFRSTDIVLRLGGDEFVVVMPETGKEVSKIAMTRLFKRFSDFIASPKPDMNIKVELSAGVSAFPEDGDTVQKVFITADAALYKAKATGKNSYAMCIPDSEPEVFIF